MKKYYLYGSIAALVIAAVAVVNVTLSLNTKSNNLSAISLANVEALAGENENGVAQIIITDSGREIIEQNNQYLSCRKNRVDCKGKGSYDCTPGYFYDDCKKVVFC
jgi:hypothetical protein